MIHRWLALLMLVVSAGPASAERLFVYDGDARAMIASMIRVDRAVARDLATNRRATVVSDVPLATGGSATFALAPIEVFAPDGQVVEFDGVQARPIARPDVAVYEGIDVAVPTRTAVLSIVDGALVTVFVRDGQRILSIVQPAGETDAHELLDPARLPADPSRRLCANHVAPAELASPRGMRSSSGTAAVSPPLGSPSPTLASEVLVDVGHGLYTDTFGSSSTTASSYAAGLFGAVSGIYRRDAGIAILIEQLVIWTTPDPFGGTSTLSQLNAYKSWNQANRVGVPRDTAHLLAHLPDEGGRAYLDALCDDTRGYGVSNINGTDSRFRTTGDQWDVQVVAHELGHNFGTPHTHCYMPPLDHCYNQEAGCYAGPVEDQVGEIMSYCHLVHSVDLALGFSPTVVTVVRGGAEAGACIGPAPGTCGNGVVEDGETCDDGNLVNGDCCADNCVAEPGLACTDDSDPCTTDVCSEAGTCAHDPPGTCVPCQAITDIPPAGGMFAGATAGPSTINTCGGGGPEAAFSWTPASDGIVRIDTCASEFFTVLHVLTGNCESGPEIACQPYGDCGALHHGARLAFQVSAGTTYYLYVDGYGGESGNYGLSVVLEPPSTCSATPLAGCKLPMVAGKAPIRFKDNGDDSKDRLRWKWGNGVTSLSDLGLPNLTDFYQLCVYDDAGLKTNAYVAPLGICNGKHCWTVNSTGFLYSNKAAGPGGIAKLSLKSSAIPGRARIQLEAKGPLFDMPNLLGLTPPLRVQLVRPGGPCWEAVYSEPTVAPDGSQLKAKSD